MSWLVVGGWLLVARWWLVVARYYQRTTNNQQLNNKRQIYFFSRNGGGNYSSNAMDMNFWQYGRGISGLASFNLAFALNISSVGHAIRNGQIRRHKLFALPDQGIRPIHDKIYLHIPFQKIEKIDPL